MIRVRFPNGQCVQYNDATTLLRQNDGSWKLYTGKDDDARLFAYIQPSAGVIVVGVKGVPLWGVWGTLVHEVIEMALCDHHVSYSTSGVFHKSTEERSFFFDHRTLTRMCDEAGNYLFECKADFDRAYRKARRKPPARKKPAGKK